MTSDLSSLRSYLQTMGIYQTSTYSYVKLCPVYVMGYDLSGLQIIKDTCLYGGIRDIAAYVYGDLFKSSLNLTASITAKAPGADLYAYLKSVISYNENLNSYLKAFYIDIGNLISQVNGVYNNSYINLSAHLYSIPPVDLEAYLNIIEIRDLPVSIQGDLLKDNIDLSAVIYKIRQASFGDLNVYLHGYATSNLSAYIGAVYSTDLSATLQGSELKNLSAYLYPILPKDLSSNIHGYDTRNLSAYLSGGYGPNDLRAYLMAISYVNLQAFISGYRGIEIPRNLSAVIEGFYLKDLSAFITAITPKDLPAYLNAVGEVGDLRAFIYPMVIHLKRIFNVSLLEHNNLWAVINAHCFGSKAVDLSAYIYPLMKSDLRANIVGWYGSFADKLGDLAAYINVSDYLVEDIITVKTLPNSVYTKLKVSFGDSRALTYNTFDTINIKFASFFSSGLSAYIYGVANSHNLSAYINAIQQIPYREIPSYMNVKTKEVVINLERFEPRWRRVAELFFDNYGSGDPFHYFYVQAENKVYKVDRSKHWILRAVGYTRAPIGTNITRQKIWRKYIVDMSRYNTIDEAVRDLIDRVTFLRRSSMQAYINGVLPPNSNLMASLTSNYYNHWVNRLPAAIKSIYGNNLSLNAALQVEQLNSTNSLSASIIGDYIYVPVDGDSVDFSFVVGDAGYSPPDYNDVDYEFNV